MSEELFKLELTEEGIYWLNKFRSVAAIVLAATVIVYGLQLYVTLPWVFKSFSDGNVFWKYRVFNILFIINMVVGFALQVIQVIFYYRFASSSNKAIETNDQALLNSSFKWLYKQAIAFCILFSVSFIYFMYSYFIRPVN